MARLEYRLRMLEAMVRAKAEGPCPKCHDTGGAIETITEREDESLPERPCCPVCGKHPFRIIVSLPRRRLPEE